MNTPDKEHLQWLYNRLVIVHGENPNYDYMRKLKEIYEKEVQLEKKHIKAVLERLQQFSYDPSYSATDPDRYPHSNRYFFSANQQWLHPDSNHPVYGGFDNLDNIAQVIFELKHEDK